MRKAQKPPNIVIFEAELDQVSIWKGFAAGYEIICLAEALTLENVAHFADAEIISTFLASSLDASVIKRLPGLKLIATRSTGFDHIDLPACAKAGISVCNVPDYGDPTVAEYVFALTLALSRKIKVASARTAQGDFSQAGLRGFDLSGKTMGVIGVGQIGRRVIQIAKGFGMTILGHDLAPKVGLESRLGFKMTDLATLLAASDVVSLNLPGGTQNIGLISETELALMKPSALLINTSRGEVVDSHALAAALAEGRLAGAGLDVFAGEDRLRDEEPDQGLSRSPTFEAAQDLRATRTLLGMPNVIATAHIAYDSREALERILNVTRKNIEGFIAGAPANLVSAQAADGRVQSNTPKAVEDSYAKAMSPLGLDVIQRRRAFLLDPGPGQVHALRGALRRARAGLLMFKDLSATGECAWIRHELERMIKLLGPLRDLDVLQAQYDLDLKAPTGALPQGFGALVVAARKASAEATILKIQAPRTAFLLDGLPDWLKAQGAGLSGRDLRAHMVRWLSQMDAQICALGETELDRGKTARHAIRGELKVLKYDFEIYDRLYSSPGARPYLAGLEALHTLLGDMNDDAMGAKLRHSLTHAGARPKNVGRPTKSRREALVLAWSHFHGLARPWGLTEVVDGSKSPPGDLS